MDTTKTDGTPPEGHEHWWQKLVEDLRDAQRRSEASIPRMLEENRFAPGAYYCVRGDLIEDGEGQAWEFTDNPELRRHLVTGEIRKANMLPAPQNIRGFLDKPFGWRTCRPEESTLILNMARLASTECQGKAIEEFITARRDEVIAFMGTYAQQTRLLRGAHIKERDDDLKEWERTGRLPQRERGGEKAWSVWQDASELVRTLNLTGPAAHILTHDGGCKVTIHHWLERGGGFEAQIYLF